MVSMGELPEIKKFSVDLGQGKTDVRYRLHPPAPAVAKGDKPLPAFELDTRPEDYRVVDDGLEVIRAELAKKHPGLKDKEVMIVYPMPPAGAEFYDLQQRKVKL